MTFLDRAIAAKFQHIDTFETVNTNLGLAFDRGNDSLLLLSHL